MNGSDNLPDVKSIKDQAAGLRRKLSENGNAISHSQALELLSHQHGFRDWNTFLAAMHAQPAPLPFRTGARISGQYLGQAVTGWIRNIAAGEAAGKFHVKLEFDKAVDVVAFQGMSNFRKRVSCTIGKDGATEERTSDGRPQLQLQLQT